MNLVGSVDSDLSNTKPNNKNDNIAKAGEINKNINNSNMNPEDDDDEQYSGRSERRKIEIQFIKDKSRRNITFSKRKRGIMKKAYELSVLTGTQILLLVVSDTGLVYTFTTPKLQPLVTKAEGKNLIQSCLNAPDSAIDESAANIQTASMDGSQNGNASQSSASLRSLMSSRGTLGSNENRTQQIAGRMQQMQQTNGIAHQQMFQQQAQQKYASKFSRPFLGRFNGVPNMMLADPNNEVYQQYQQFLQSQGSMGQQPAGQQPADQQFLGNPSMPRNIQMNQ